MSTVDYLELKLMSNVSYTHLIFVMVYITKAHIQDVPITESIFGLIGPFWPYE